MPHSTLLVNTTNQPERYCFDREDSLAYVTSRIPADTIPADHGDNTSSWFDLLPGHQAHRCGPFEGINWEPVQSLVTNSHH